jgi:hypothetical protein
MENTWYPVFYNGLETNIEVTECGKLKRVFRDWVKINRKIGEIDFNLLSLSRGYQVISIMIKSVGDKCVFTHQLVASCFHNYIFQGHKLVVDHIDSNKLNNHKDNLQVITQRENSSKKITANNGLPTGVTFDKSKNNYMARITINNKSVYLGRYSCPEEASAVYQKALNEIQSEPINPST